MTEIVSIRLESEIEQAIRRNAARSRMTVSSIAGVILEHSLCGQYSFSALKDSNEFLDAKLDIRLPNELISKLRVESKRLRVSVSVYIRRILYAYYTKRLVFTETEGHYTLGENRDQTKGA
jgi:predicted DNA-binding protein